MIDPSEVAHVQMPVPQYPPSDESEGTFNSELRDLVDSRLPPLPPDDPSASFTSTQSGHIPSTTNGQPSGQERRRKSHKKDRNSASLQREMVRLLASEEVEAKSTRKYLRVALDRLEGEARRAQEAERRALEIAERFRVVNEARQSAQSELTRVTEELRLWRNQYENAQREILRARDVFKELEEQRNSAESDATKYRSLARKLNEERLINQAREEGRREGYEEGLRRGMEQGRSDVYSSRSRAPNGPFREPDSDSEEDQAIEQRQMQSDDIPSLDIPTRLQLANLPLRGGTQFHENFTPMSTASRSLAPAPEPSTPEPPRIVRPPSAAYNRPPSVNHPDSSVPPDNYIPELNSSDNRISLPPPHEFIARTGSPYSDNQPLPVPGPTNTMVNFVQVPQMEPMKRDVFTKIKSSPPSIAESVQSSLQSTTMSQYEILAPSHGQKKDRSMPPRPPMDRIDEVSSAMEHSPGFEKRSMSSFPVASASGDSDWGEGSHGIRSRKTSYQSLGNGTPRSRTTSQGQRAGDEARYSSTSGIDTWRREAASTQEHKQFANSSISTKPVYPSGLRHELSSSSSLKEHSRPRSVTTPRPRSPVGPRPTTPVNARLDVPSHSRSLQTSPASAASGEYVFSVEPPSGPASISSPVTTIMNASMLSPIAVPEPLPRPMDPPLVSTEPSTSTMRQSALGIPMPPPPSVGDFPPGFMPVSVPANVVGPSSSMNAPPIQQSKTHPAGLLGGPTWNMKVPDRMASVQGRPRSQTPSITYEAAPAPEGVHYPAPPFGRPRDSPKMSVGDLDAVSPRSNPSRLSPGGHQRSLSLNAGATPGMSTRPLSGNPAPKLRKMPSSESVGSNLSGRSRASGSVSHFDPTQYVDVSALASSEDLLASMQSPTTAANTKANAGTRSIGGAMRGPGGVDPSMPQPEPVPSSSSTWTQLSRGKNKKRR